MTRSSYFAWDAVDNPDAPCVRDDSEALSYADFADRVEACAEQLGVLGVERGDVVATFLANRVELLVVLMAAWRLGAIGTPVNPAFTADEAEYQLADAQVRVVVGDTAGTPDPDRIILQTNDISQLPSAKWRAPRAPHPDEDALLIYTSGSTGRPKGVRLTHSNLHFMAASMVTHCRLTAQDHALLILPLFHVNAICVSFLAPMLAGAQLSVTGKFSVSRFFDDVSRLRPTYFSAVPTIYALLSSQHDAPPAPLESIRFAICGAAPISRELLDRAESFFGFPIVEGYGLTEGTCASACNPVAGVRKLGTVGPALPGQVIRIVDAEGRDVPVGQTGEVIIGGPNVMRGYLNRPKATADTVIDGWLHTGDIGLLDDDGYLSIVDRIKDMIIRGGENVYPKEIENALATHPAILECAVVGVPDDLHGEVPVAYAVAYPNHEVTVAELIAHLDARLARIKRPVAIHLRPDLPRNPVGKIDKPTLRLKSPTPQTI
ncbi:class I adenylate-forming enzyme family protein [Gordonia sp. CPCC 205333]|uniref:class I adenylate-forming enzyme family protein n=1 Tax=Gordonia sp. CPCC 205333 TaxID=3140790 RepID=UPI003AF3BF84